MLALALLAAAFAQPPVDITVSAPSPSPRVEPLPPEIRAAMTGVTWHEGCPVSLDALRLVHVRYLGPDGAVHAGSLVVHEDEAQAIAGVFDNLLAQGFVIARVAPAYTVGGDDEALMRANITSAFNCRKVAGTSAWSEHSTGKALDLNPLWNPWVHGDQVDPPQAKAYVSRDPSRPGTITADGPVVAAFAAIGWHWGGNWKSSKDYQHFSSSGR